MPAFGSVTQSLNVVDGRTKDMGSLIHAADGSLILQVARDNRASLEISPASGTVLEASSCENCSSLDDAVHFVSLQHGVTYTELLSTRRATFVPAPGARAYREGDIIDGQLYAALGGGAARGYPVGHSLYLHHDEFDVGEYCVSDTGQCTVQSSGVAGERATVTEGTLWLKAGGPAAVPRWEADDDYLTFGYWLRPQSGAMPAEGGFFASGARPFSVSGFAALSGTATYAGPAQAVALGDSRDADAAPFLRPSFEGDGRLQLYGLIELTADFSVRTLQGTILLEGDYDPYDGSDEPPAPSLIVLDLGSAPIDFATSGGTLPAIPRRRERVR